MVAMSDDSRRVPPWLLGLIIAAVIFTLGYLIYQGLGFGDDPVIGSAGQMAHEWPSGTVALLI